MQDASVNSPGPQRQEPITSVPKALPYLGNKIVFCNLKDLRTLVPIGVGGFHLETVLIDTSSFTPLQREAHKSNTPALIRSVFLMYGPYGP